MKQELIKTRDSKLQHSHHGKHEPRMEYEIFRRRIRHNIEELWNYFSSELNKINKKVSIDNPVLIDQIANVSELGAEHIRSLISDIDGARMMDGYEQWRQDESKSLSDLVQRRLHYLQNPKDCKNARKLICKLNKKGSGFGFELHHAVYCFILAYGTERTLILTSDWKYEGGFEDIFQPLSETCLNIEPTKSTKKWPAPYDVQVVEYQISNKFRTTPPYLPLSIPADLAPRLMRLHGDPSAWWIGQFFKYLLHKQNATHEMIESRMEKLGFKKPIVGVHVRRTDKKIVTEYHNIEEYMIFIEDYFLQQEMSGKKIKRRIFLASDEVSVIDEAREKYPSYEIIGDMDVAKMAGLSTRYTSSSLNGIVSDIFMLSSCDYIVCTLSSNICRAVYEIIQTMYPDASNRLKSIDRIYFYAGENTLNNEAFLPHDPRNHDEIHLLPGDHIEISSNHWNGYSEGKNTRTNQTGFFPSFKVKNKVETIKLPNYANVN